MPMRRSSLGLRSSFALRFSLALFLSALLLAAPSGKCRPLSARLAKPPTKPRAQVKSFVPTAESLFVQVLRSDDLFPYKGRQITTYWRTGRATEVLVFHRPVEDRRLQFLNPEPQRGRLLASDGAEQWEYEPHEKALRHRRLSPGAQDDDDLLSYTLLRANYLLSVDPKPRTVAERKTYLVTVKRPAGGTLARRFWIDRGTGLILKREIYGEDGKLAVTVGFSDISYHVALPSSLFNLSSLAKTVRVTELPTAEIAAPLGTLRTRLGGFASAPATLGGYRLVGATTTKIGKHPVLHLRYSDGLNLVSVFEQRRTQPNRPTLVPPGMRVVPIGATPVHVGHRASLTTLNWDTPTLNVTLMGEMGFATLRTLAQRALEGK